MKKINDTVITFVLSCFVFALIFFSDKAKQGAREGIELCENIIIPSLLPVIIICGIITRYRSAYVTERLFGRVFEKAFLLPGACAGAVIFGLVGGYPAGAVLCKSLFDSERIDTETAKRLMRFNFSGGAAFLISALGGVVYQSKRLGFALFSINLLSSLIIAFITRKHTFYPDREKNNYLSFSDSLILSAQSAVKSLALMCVFIILFSASAKIIKPPVYLLPLFEITSGVCKSKMPLPFLAFFTSFGGICIHLQLIGLLKGMGVNLFDFFIFRILGGVISFVLSKLFLLAFPDVIAVSLNLTKAKPVMFNNSVSLSVVMIIGCAVIIFDIENRKLKSP